MAEGHMEMETQRRRGIREALLEVSPGKWGRNKGRVGLLYLGWERVTGKKESRVFLELQ
jgi:hypothetical protein